MTQQGEAHAPLGAIAGIDGGGATVDAHDGAHHGLQVLVLEGDLLSAAEVVAGWLRVWGGSGSAARGFTAGSGFGGSMAAWQLPPAAFAQLVQRDLVSRMATTLPSRRLPSRQSTKRTVCPRCRSFRTARCAAGQPAGAR